MVISLHRQQRTMDMDQDPEDASIYRKIIDEFATFFILKTNSRGYPHPISQPDPHLRRLIESLICCVEADIAIDGWARYFLLIGRHTTAAQATSLSALDVAPLEASLRSYLQASPRYNLPVQHIYQELRRQQYDAHLTLFISSAPRGVEQMLLAHLQKISWDAAQHTRYLTQGRSQLQQLFSLDDYFQIASSKVCQPIPFLKHFRFESANTIKTYAKRRLVGVISDAIQAQDREERTHKLSPDGLLRTLSKKEVEEALKANGLPPLEIIHHRLIWQAYMDVYQPTQDRQKRLQPPTPDELERMCDRYTQLQTNHNEQFVQKNNPRSRKPDQPNPSTDLRLSMTVTSATIQTSLHLLDQAIRRYRSADAVHQRWFEETGESIPSLLDQEWGDELSEFHTTFRDAFAQLDSVAQTVLQLWLGLGISQSDLTQLLGSRLNITDQYQLSRKAKKYKQDVLKTFVQIWKNRYPEFFTAQDIHQMIQNLNELFDPCLEEFCRQSFDQPLNTWLKTVSPDQRSLLYLYYRQHLPPDLVAEQNQRLPVEVRSMIDQLHASARDQLQSWITTTIPIDWQTCNSLSQKLDAFVERWLSDQPI